MSDDHPETGGMDLVLGFRIVRYVLLATAYCFVITAVPLAYDGGSSWLFISGVLAFAAGYAVCFRAAGRIEKSLLVKTAGAKGIEDLIPPVLPRLVFCVTALLVVMAFIIVSGWFPEIGPAAALLWLCPLSAGAVCGADDGRILRIIPFGKAFQGWRAHVRAASGKGRDESR